MIITFSGIDGAGKTTQIDCLISSLNSKKYSLYYFWSRGGYTPGIEALKAILRFFLRRKIPGPGKNSGRSKAMQNPIIARTWLSMAILDLIYYYCILIRFKSIMGKVVICDRYLVDTYIDFSLNFTNIAFEKMFLWRILMKFHKKPSLSFLFTLEAQESIRRSKIKDEPFPDSEDIINKRLEHYQNLDLKFADNWVVIDGLDNIESSKKIINKKTFELLKKNYAS